MENGISGSGKFRKNSRIEGAVIVRAERIMVEDTTMTILSLEGNQEINQHAKLKIKGYVDEKTAEKIMRKAQVDEKVTVTVMGQDSKQVFFEGLVYSMEQEVKDRVCHVELELVSDTMKLAGMERTRTFQNERITYGQLIEKITQEETISAQLEVLDEAIGNMVVQYRENNWEFLLRLASQMKTCVIPQVKGQVSSFVIGLSKTGNEIPPEGLGFTVKNQVQMLRDKSNKGIDVYAQDGLSYVFQDREIHALGDYITIGGRSYYISKIESFYEGQELWHSYVAQSEQNFEMITYQNIKMTGASLLGKISKVQGVKVAVSLDVDIDNDICGMRMLPYATVYSSPDGTGWYCMPEIGDIVRVYFPTEFAKDAYVISAVHAEASNGMKTRNNPDTKSFSNVHNKEIILSPTGITITNNAGMSVSLDDNVGLTIESNLPIYLNAADYVEISAEESVYIHSCGEFKVEQGEDTYIDMDEGVVTLSGDEFRLQEK